MISRDALARRRPNGRRRTRSKPPEAAAAIAEDDLLFARACVAGQPSAVRRFEARYLPVVRKTLARLVSAFDRDDIEQRLVEALLVGGARRAPELIKYEGRGPLEQWVRISAARFALSWLRSERAERAARGRALLEAVATGPDPELLYLKQSFHREFGAALEGALGALTPKQRLVLRLHYVGGMTLTCVARAFGVSQPTVSRWLAAIHAGVSRRVRASLGRSLGMTAVELSRAARLIQSQIEISMTRILAPS
jgi:RNA polymerase sigma-70 factor (ECF subfamily)